MEKRNSHNRRVHSDGGTLPSLDLSRRAVVKLRITTAAVPHEVITTNDGFALAPRPVETADDWVRSHLRDLGRYEGRWLAVSKKGVVAAGESLLDVRTAADAAGFGRESVIVFKLPSQALKKAVSTRKW